jgi:hypothetical protein
MYSTSVSVISLLVLLKMKNENGNIEGNLAVMIKVRSYTNSLGKKHVTMLGLYESFGCCFCFGVMATIICLVLAGTYVDCEKPRSP